jgi:hypothetical protein
MKQKVTVYQRSFLEMVNDNNAAWIVLSILREKSPGDGPSSPQSGRAEVAAQAKVAFSPGLWERQGTDFPLQQLLEKPANALLRFVG